jgi:chromosome segregation ATPase
MELGTIVELIVLGAIAIELFALYNHSKFDAQIDEHILDTDRSLEKYDVMIQVLSDSMTKLNEHLIRLDEHMVRNGEQMTRYDEHLIRLDEHMTRYDEQMTRYDEHTTRYDRRLSEYMSRLDDLIWKSYFQGNANINDRQVSKDEETSPQQLP